MAAGANRSRTNLDYWSNSLDMIWLLGEETRENGVDGGDRDGRGLRDRVSEGGVPLTRKNLRLEDEKSNVALRSLKEVMTWRFAEEATSTTTKRKRLALEVW
ncbi:unnamed protein product [Linum trigynum]|uniref:Uncharacterized protein n=1 Tax=Linum trigynum TaxID=586398 RepID=A0AAV2DNB7_9ROSI